MEEHMPTALVTGASRGLGRALALALAQRGWGLVVDARSADPLREVQSELRSAGAPTVAAVTGDVSDPAHRRQLVAAVSGVLDLLVNNASLLGPSPQPSAAEYPLDVLERVYAVNVIGALGLVQLALPRMRPGALLLNITSDAAVEAYPGWGGYGSSKAALEQLTEILAVENPHLRVHAVDPGDMNTRMQAEAFPGEDISDRPDPSTVVPALMALIDGVPAGVRVRAADIRVPA
jgi:NAD(P)-dependent dehydrogenase (short-subunit alcohol dehydrogenase family)